MESWRIELKAWANQSVEELAQRDGILGVVMGGSLARGQEWRQSDLEVGVLVEEKDNRLPYFNVIHGRGVEIIQLVRADLAEQVERVEDGEITPVLSWPIQLWQGRMIYDPSGLLGRFQKQFDARLFSEEVIAARLSGLRTKMGSMLDEARGLICEGRPSAALVRTRLAMNDAILGLHWHYGELPRSQNRTDSRLRQLCRRHDNAPFYELYREVFDLADTQRVIKKVWPLVKAEVLEITRLWGDSARDFFVHAVDSDFRWRQNAGILTVYRLYIPIIGGPEQGIFDKLDDREWVDQNQDLVRFLGLEHADQERVSEFVERLTMAARIFDR